MGCTSAKTTTESTQDSTQQTTFAPRTSAEQTILDSLSGLGQGQRDVLMQRIQELTSGASPYALSPADHDMLNQSYNSAQQELDLANKDYADFLSGGRGMRMSDTPISSQAMQRQALGQAALSSDKARSSLNLGMGASQYRMNSALGLSAGMPAGLAAAFNPQFQERLAGGTQTFHGTSKGSTTSTPSLLSSIGQGIGIAGQLGAMAMPFLAPGVGSLGSSFAAPSAANASEGYEGLRLFTG